MASDREKQAIHEKVIAEDKLRTTTRDYEEAMKRVKDLERDLYALKGQIERNDEFVRECKLKRVKMEVVLLSVQAKCMETAGDWSDVYDPHSMAGVCDSVSEISEMVTKALEELRK